MQVQDDKENQEGSDIFFNIQAAVMSNYVP